MYLTYTSVKAPDLGEEKTHLIGKLIGYLVTDFIKANNHNLIDRKTFQMSLNLYGRVNKSKILLSQISLYLLQAI
jgi:hypothetical protein